MLTNIVILNKRRDIASNVIDDFSCPVLVKEIDEALHIRREIHLNEKVDEARKAVIEAEEKKKADKEYLENLRVNECKLRKEFTALSTAADVAAEQVIAASSKNHHMKKEVEEAKKVSSEARNLLIRRIEELKVETEKRKEVIEETVSTVQKAAGESHEINRDMSFQIKVAKDAKSHAENELCHAKKEENNALHIAEASVRAARLAFLVQEEACKRHKEAQELVEALILEVNDKYSKLSATINVAEKINKAANEEVQKAVQEVATIEKEITEKVEKASAEKCKAEEIARKLDEYKIKVEARALIAERLALLAVESKEKVIRDAREVKEKFEKSGYNIIVAEKKLQSDRAQLEERKKITLERLAAVTKLRCEAVVL